MNDLARLNEMLQQELKEAREELELYERVASGKQVDMTGLEDSPVMILFTIRKQNMILKRDINQLNSDNLNLKLKLSRLGTSPEKKSEKQVYSFDADSWSKALDQLSVYTSGSGIEANPNLSIHTWNADEVIGIDPEE